MDESVRRKEFEAAGAQSIAPSIGPVLGGTRVLVSGAGVYSSGGGGRSGGEVGVIASVGVAGVVFCKFGGGAELVVASVGIDGAVHCVAPAAVRAG